MMLAAIDIGSNAARLLIVDVVEPKKAKPEFTKVNLIRVPLRLGIDVFTKGKIGRQREKMILESMQAFRHLLSAYNVRYLRACATSAMRDASNSAEIIKEVKKLSRINIRIISGDEEASIVFESHIADNLDKNKGYLYIDVGGGSTELSFFYKGRHIYRQSFNIGTIRLLQGLVQEDDWKNMQAAIQKNILKKEMEIIGIGSGGNINKIFSMSKKKDGQPLSATLLREYLRDFSALTVAERISQYGLREDRADVIVPALQIYVNVAKWVGIRDVFVPKIGLVDGLVHKMYEDLKRKEKDRASV